MRIDPETYVCGGSEEMEPVLNELAEVIVQLRRISQLSRSVLVKLENRSQFFNPSEQLELETKHQSILANMVKTAEAINQMNRQISKLLQNGQAVSSARDGGSPGRLESNPVRPNTSAFPSKNKTVPKDSQTNTDVRRSGIQ